MDDPNFQSAQGHCHDSFGVSDTEFYALYTALDPFQTFGFWTSFSYSTTPVSIMRKYDLTSNTYTDTTLSGYDNKGYRVGAIYMRSSTLEFHMAGIVSAAYFNPPYVYNNVGNLEIFTDSRGSYGNLGVKQSNKTSVVFTTTDAAITHVTTQASRSLPITFNRLSLDGLVI